MEKVYVFPEKQKNNCGSSELRVGESVREEVLLPKGSSCVRAQNTAAF